MISKVPPRPVSVGGAVQREAVQWQAMFFADRQGAVADRDGDVLDGCGARLRASRIEHQEL